MHGQRSYLVALIGGIHNLSLVRELSKSADRFLPFVISVCMIFVRLCSRSQQLKVKTRRHICNSRHIERYLEPDIVLTRNGGWEGWGFTSIFVARAPKPEELKIDSIPTS